ncbi:MAG TPA: Mov34/MPN/PAD-1 family protein [Candidatus Thermoplasmatota archaeon]|nr:Mov34/MPN/PAD-1 family protein [Candidatus Thermoplasmatota archaeon]
MGLFRRDKERAPEPPRRRRVWAIHQEVLDLVKEAARESHPREFGATLRAEGGILTEVVLTPGTIGGERHTFINWHKLPIDASIVGTVHSHPGPYAVPSDADKQVFNAFGHTHIIIAEPYTDETWIAYDQNAEPVELDVVDD